MKISIALTLVLLASCAKPDGTEKSPATYDDGSGENVGIVDSGADDSSDDDNDVGEGEDSLVGISVGSGGNWNTPCYRLNNEYITRAFRTDDEYYYLTTIYYEDEGCATASAIYEIHEQSYELSSRQVSLEQPEDYLVETFVVSYSINILSSSYARELSENSYCGVNDWKAIVVYDISGFSCGTRKFAATGAKKLDLIYFENDSEILKFGSDPHFQNIDEQPSNVGDIQFNPTHF
ncbi:MAG: hypothetical protein HRU19_02955 [Pseudobacteriovorax sp.]|nr:hypothetical protein [Pseudobacteriovorax sp.]